MVGILILNYNNTKDIKECIDSLIEHVDLSATKILVVDNGSIDEIYNDIGSYLSQKFDMLQKLQNNTEIANLWGISYLRLSQNLGYAKGNNEGLKYFYADSDINYIMILNSDIIITEDFIPKMKDYINNNPNIAVASPLLYKRNGAIDYCCARRALYKEDILKTFSYIFNKKYIKALDRQKILKNLKECTLQEPISIEFPSGSCMMFKKDVMQKIGGFDPNTFLYYEENILCRKIQKLGMECALLPYVSCIHTGGATTTTVKTSYFLKKCNVDSLLYYLKTYEDCSKLELLYVKVTGSMRLLRLWFGQRYKNCVKVLVSRKIDSVK